MRRWARGVALAVAALAFGAGAAYAAASLVDLPAPIVSASSVTFRGGNADSVGIAVRWVRVCRAIGGIKVCPSRHDMRVDLHSSDGTGVWMTARYDGQFRDVVTVQRRPCALTGSITDTVRVSVRAVATGPGGRSRPGNALGIVVRCRPMRPTERIEALAFVDSFPPANNRVVTADWGFKIGADSLTIMQAEQLQLARTLADSQIVTKEYADLVMGADSVRFVDHVLIGYKYQLCQLARNRFTGRVIVVGGPDAACEPPRARMQSEGNG